MHNFVNKISANDALLTQIIRYESQSSTRKSKLQAKKKNEKFTFDFETKLWSV